MAEKNILAYQYTFRHMIISKRDHFDIKTFASLFVLLEGATFNQANFAVPKTEFFRFRVVVLLLNNHGQQLWSCQDDQ